MKTLALFFVPLLAGCGLFQSIDVEASVEDLRAMNEELAGKDQAIVQIIEAAGTSIDPTFRAQILQTNQEGTERYQARATTMHQRFFEYTRPDWAGIMNAGFEIWIRIIEKLNEIEDSGKGTLDLSVREKK